MTATDMSPRTGSVPAAPEIDPKGMRVVWLLLIAAFVAILNETTMSIAIPHLNVDLGVPPELGQWLTSAFMLTMAVVIPTTGFLLQRLTTRQAFVVAMSLFTAGTIICLVAPGFTLLLIGRIVQAAGTAITMPLLMTTVMSVVPAHARGRIMGRVGIVISLAPAIGPTLAGVLLDIANWRWIFGTVLPFAVVALVIGIRLLTNLGETSRAPLDVFSVVLSALAFGGLVFGLTQIGGSHGGETTATAESPVLAIAIIAGSVVLLAGFIWRQIVLQRIDDALLDLRVFASRNFTMSIVVMGILSLAMFGTFTALPLYMQNVVGLSATESGLIVLPGAIVMGLLGPIIGRIYDARGPRVTLIPGTMLVAGVMAFYATLTEGTPVVALVIAQTVMSVGMAMSFTPIFSASLGSLQRRFYSHGSAVLNTLQQVAGAAGVAVLITTMSSVSAAQEASGVAELAAGAAGARAAFLFSAIVAIVAVVAAFFVRKPVDNPEGVGAAH
ncbi:DHA2 family efflux MFS transporter permease subunit [Microbacterium marinilacus]|uniref:DHA2 family efflux MFS transporter permease subunit n=1 Tax=Microbacterium marinilacus TaxID=415209 RepID=A0ABP7B8V9_9MICO|nr:DHA2 family efflux MFS transporter permease subunit [Microbacterium marinilacus]MBY0687469.1 DHA2 family efflux MFS transporter permease subunit [Microbacterium marinilacus]